MADHAHAISPHVPEGAPPSFTIGDAYGLGWQSFTSNYGMLLGVVVLSMLMSFAVMIVQFVVIIIPLLGMLVSLAITIFVSVPLFGGAMYVGVKACRRESIYAGDIFIGFSRYGSVLAIGILNWLIAMACMIPFYCLIGAGLFTAMGASSRSAGGSPSLGISALGFTILGAIAGVVAILCITSRLSLATMVCLDPAWRRAPAMDCMRISWRITARHWPSLIALYLLNALIAFGTSLLLGIGLVLLGLPLILSVMGAAYCLIVSPYFSDRCTACGYDLSAIETGVCPECGAPIPPQRGTAWQSLRYRMPQAL